MINCICVDIDKRNRSNLERMIKEIDGLHLLRTCANLGTAYKICKTQRVDVSFVHLYILQVPPLRTKWLDKIAKTGTKIVIISSSVALARDSTDLHAEDFVLLPTSSRRLWKATKKALQIDDYGIEDPVITFKT